MTSKDPNSHSPQAHVSHSSSSNSNSNSKGKEPLSSAGPGTKARTDTTTAAATPSTSAGGFISAIATSARNAASAIDPRQASVISQHHSLNNTPGGGSSSSSGFLAGSNSKAGAAASSASRSFQHATTALERTLEGSSHDSSRDATAFAQPSSGGFRHPAGSGSGSGAAAGTGAMDWDNFLASSDSTVQEDRPYQPPSMSSFNFSTLATPESVLYRQPQPQQQVDHQEQQAREAREFDSAFQAHLSQPMNLTPANHSAFLDYLKSTGHPPTSQTTPTTAAPSTVQHQWHTPTTDPGMSMISDDIQRQRHMDGSDVLAFLESTSYSDFVDELEAAGGMIDRHQHDRREFVYSEASSSSSSSNILFSTLQLIQNLPSERQDIVQYLLSQGTYSEDVWARPFGHDDSSHEAASMAATLAEQDAFLRRQHDKVEHGGGEVEEGDDATTAEMERVLKQIVDDAKTEVKTTGQTDGRAVNRLLMVRSHITMGTKL
ncbi:hypothetical protein KVV02_000826 [Mortierella alpina]|uniref:Uncharacterized protein n=1 Tax=Mortierella alpina TaxID=64518 RepID=A0A9P8A3W1_MORAP|nr:hypothetical protein KVV02_000826 [Mortierella alpina]